MGRLIGIDLGTTKSVAAVMQGVEPLVIPTAGDDFLFPSVVGFSEEGEQLVGREALRLATASPESTIVSFRRMLGCPYDDPKIKSVSQSLPYRTTREAAGDVQVYVPAVSRHYSLVEITATILRELKRRSETYLGESVSGAVVTVPATFNYVQRWAIKEAGQIADLEVTRLIAESTAAGLKHAFAHPYALHYATEDLTPSRTILIFCLGAGTHCISVLGVDEDFVQVNAVSGNSLLGGDDWDWRIVRWMLDKVNRKQNPDLLEDCQFKRKMLNVASKAKTELSSMTETSISLPTGIAVSSTPKQPQMQLSRLAFEQLTQDLVQKCRESLEQALQDAETTRHDLDAVFLVGGATHMPMIQSLVRDLTGKSSQDWILPDKAPAIGAAIYAGIVSGELRNLMLLDAAPFTVGMETLGGAMKPLVKRNTSIPAGGGGFFTSTEDGQPAVDIRVYEGESQVAADNLFLGHLCLDGIPPAPQGMPKIDVTLNIHTDTALTVRAKDVSTGREQEVTLREAPALGSQEEFQQFDVTPTSAPPSARDRLIALLAESKKRRQTDVARPLPPEPLHGRGHRWAVLVGVNEYEDSHNYPHLQVCTRDVEAIRDQLVAGGFALPRIQLLTDNSSELPIRAKILVALKAIADATEPDDLLLFYYSGHGDADGGESYLVARDGRRLVLGDTAVSVSRVKQIVDEAPARAKVIVLDACHSGADIGGKGPKPMSEAFIRRVFEEAEGMAILASCTQGQLSYEWRDNERSVFTHFLLEALQGQADHDGKGFVTVQDASRYVTDGVKLWASKQQVSQTPTLEGSFVGDIILTHCRK